MKPFDLCASIREHLGSCDEVRGFFRQIGGAMELTGAQRHTKTLPALFVIPLADTAGSPLWAGTFRQKKDLRIAIVIAAPDAKLAEAREWVERHLIPGDTGWIPSGCSDVMAWAAGKLAQIDDNGTIWWQDEYATSRLVRTPC